MKSRECWQSRVVLRREARECRQWRVRCELVGRSFRNANHAIVVTGVPICLEHSAARLQPAFQGRRRGHQPGTARR
jgi:hypothetical protein